MFFFCFVVSYRARLVLQGELFTPFSSFEEMTVDVVIVSL